MIKVGSKESLTQETGGPRPPDQAYDVGLIGLGLLGSAMAGRLLASGMKVAGFDLVRAKCCSFADLGGCPLPDARRVVERCQRILLVLPDDRISAGVMEDICPYLSAGDTLLDATTGAPAAAEATAARLAELGVDFLDATVSGSSEQVTRGEAVYFVGGQATAVDRNADVFRALGGRMIPTGPAGSGAKMKLITNLVLGLNRAALAEGLAFAKALGVDGETALAGLRASLGYSRIMDSKGSKMISGDFTPVARLSQHLKDVRLILEATPLSLPLSQAHCSLLEKAVTLGYGDLDNSAIIKALEEDPS